ELEKLKRQENKANDAVWKEASHETQDVNTNITNLLNAVSTPVSAVGPSRALNDGIVTDFNNLETTVNVSLTPTTRIQTIHPKTQILGDPMSAVQTRSKVKNNSKAHALVYRNKKDEKGVVVRNKARLVAQGHSQEEGIDYDESAFLYGTIDEEVYVTQPPSFVDPKFPNKVYKVVKALYGLHQDPRAWYDTLSTFLERSGYRGGAIDKTLFIQARQKGYHASLGELTFFLGLQVKQKEDGIFISQDKYVAKILKNFDFLSVKTASTLIETQKPLLKDKEAADVDVYFYRFQVTPKTSYLQAVKRIFRYLKGQPKLGLWYPKVSSFDLEAYSDINYAGANLDRKFTTGATLVKGRLLEVTTIKHSKELASPNQTALEQTTAGKEISNPLMADSLPKTILLTFIHGICIDMDPFEFSLVYLVFWSMAKVKTVNDKVSVQALINAKRVNIKESSIRRTLKLDDEEGTSCLAIDEICTGLANIALVLKPPPRMKLTSLWNQQSFVLPQTRSLTSQVDHQLGDMSHHQDIYDNPSFIKKVFANMKRVGTSFSRVITLLFENMLVPAAKEVGQAQDGASIPTEPYTSKPHKRYKSKKQQPIAPKVPSPEPSPEHQLPSPSNDPIPIAKDSLKFQELMDLCTRLSNKVLDLESEVIDIKSSFTNKMEKCKQSIYHFFFYDPNKKLKIRRWMMSF
nr:hypothetical protein [Tanacetum cinerariifolium]